jgi:hypothetical protein
MPNSLMKRDFELICQPIHDLRGRLAPLTPSLPGSVDPAFKFP